MSLPLSYSLQSYWFFNLRHGFLRTFNRMRRKVYQLIGKPSAPLPTSPEPITVVIPVGPADSAIVGITIAHIRKHLKNRIAEVLLIGPGHLMLDTEAKLWNARFINESAILPRGFIDYPFDYNFSTGGQTLNRRGWIIQQLLKLNTDTIAKTPYIFVADADTIYINDFTLLTDTNQTVLLTSDEYHRPYHQAMANLLGTFYRPAHSHVCHGMLFKAETLKSLRQHIEITTNLPWWQAILATCTPQSGISPFSEYETYATYLRHITRQPFTTAYWYNRPCPRPDGNLANAITDLATRYRHKHLSLSFHTY